jgi:putative methyltransferase (TIGR04325 family)
MTVIIKELKQVLRGLVESTPFLSDLYYQNWHFYKYPNAFRGVYKSFSSALTDIPQNHLSTYNITELYVDSLVRLEAGERISYFDPRDYPILFWLKSILDNDKSIFDFGGNVGSSYYAYQYYLAYPKNLRWLVCDLPTAIEIGKKILEKNPSKNIFFTENLDDAEDADIFLTCGTLQYIESSISDLLEKLLQKPRHLLINRVPIYEGETYITLQNLIDSIVPYKIQNRAKLISELESLGYELIDSWKDSRTCFIPFHPELFVDGYHGFYFRYKHA